MDIKNLLNQELESAKKDKEQKETEEAALYKEAANLFQPIAAAMEQLKSELSAHAEIRFSISLHDVTAHLGDDIKLRTYRYGWSTVFSVEETTTSRYPEDEIDEYTYKFNDANGVVAFMVKRCAAYLANKRGE